MVVSEVGLCSLGANLSLYVVAFMFFVFLFVCLFDFSLFL